MGGAWCCRGNLSVIRIIYYIATSNRPDAIFRLRALRVKDCAEKALLDLCWQTARDVCSLVACHTAFEDCKDAEGYDLGKTKSVSSFPVASHCPAAIWQLVSLSEWIIDFIVKLLSECVLSRDAGPKPTSDDDPLDSVPCTPSPQLYLSESDSKSQHQLVNSRHLSSVLFNRLP